MYLLTFIGVIIAGVSLNYTRKTAMKEEEEVEEAQERIEKPETPRSAKPKKNKASKDQIIWTHFLHKDIKIQEYSHLTTEQRAKLAALR